MGLETIGTLIAGILGIILYVLKSRQKTPLERANETWAQKGRADAKIELQIAKKDTQGMEDDFWRRSRELSALFSLRRKGPKADG